MPGARVIAVLAAVALPGAAPAEECADSRNIIEQTACAQDAYRRHDAELNAIWPEVMRAHPSGGDRAAHRADIRAAQRAWIAFRDADCAARSKVGIPKYWAMNEFSCLADMTRARIETLTEAYLY